MASLGPDDYGMPINNPFPWRGFFVCAAILAAAIGYAIWTNWPL